MVSVVKVTRNQIMDALMAILKANMPTVATFSRRFKIPANASASAEMPLLQLVRPQTMYPPRPAKSMPAKRTMDCEIYIWFSDGMDQSIEPDRAACTFEDQLDVAFRPPVGQDTLTLGGLVDHCLIQGDIISVPGDVDGLGMIKVPVTIVIP